MKPKAGRRRRTGDRQIHKMASIVDDLREFEEFREQLLPALRRDIQAGLTAERIYQKYSDIAAARTVSILALEEDSSKVIAAIKEILDRSQGKAVERKDISHKLGRLSDNELDALLLTEIAESKDEEDPAE